jgi:hypothetical protein
VKFTATATAGVNIFYQDIAGGKFAVGDRLLVTGIVSTSGGITAQIKTNFNGGSPSNHTPQNVGLLAVTRQRLHMEVLVPAGTTSIDFLLSAGAGTGWVQYGQMSVYNLTALGALA